MNWTAPFHGVQHLNGLHGRFQITVYDRGSSAECKVFLPGHGFNATTTTHPTIDAARQHGEAQSVAIGAAEAVSA